MPQTPTPNMALVQPSENADSDIWDTLLTALFLLIDQHNHEPGKGIKVTPAGMNFNADVSLTSGGNFFALANVKAVDFQPQSAANVASYAGALFVNSVDNELYWRNTSGTNVKLTTGTTINASLLGGIGGDYASVGAIVDFVDATDLYRLRQQIGAGVFQYARVAHGDLDLYEYIASGGVVVPPNRVRLKSPAALAASYDLTLPTALPPTNANSIVQISTTGAVTVSNTIPAPVSVQQLTASGAIQGASLTSTGTLSVTGTASLVGGVTNTVNFAAGLSVPTNFHVNLNGTSKVKHGVRTRYIPVSAFVNTSGNITYSAGVGAQGAALTALAPYAGLDLIVGTNGDRLITVTADIFDAVFAASTYRMELIDGSSVVATGTTSNGSGTQQTLTITYNGTFGFAPALRFVRISGTGECTVIGPRFTYDNV